jgi:dTDP-4-amino-4,6-dideoxygalactose transaminase
VRCQRDPLRRPKAQYRSIKPEIDAAIGSVLESSQFALGSEVAAFEREFAEYCGVAHAVGVNSGTSALHLALLAADIGPGDEVVTSPFTFVATVAAIFYTGARPTYADVDPRSFTIDPAKIEAAITPKTKAIMPVHLYGQIADMDPILDIARRRKLLVIEDAAQAHGARYKGKRAGSLGQLGCFSFYPGKNLGAYGEGGAVVTNDANLADAIRVLRDWGQTQKYRHTRRGYNYRLEGIQGAILRVKLRKLDGWNTARREHAAEYTKLLAHGPVKTPEAMAWGEHVFHVYAVRTADRAGLQKHLGDRQIQNGIHYPYPVHLQEAYADPAYPAGSMPQSEAAASEVLSLPMFAELSSAQIVEVAQAIQAFPGR